MQKTVINLHYEKKRRVTMICIIILLFIIFYISYTIIAKKYFEQMSSLLKSNYKYSAYMVNSENDDAYLVYDAGINFGVKKDYEYSLNVDVVMQTRISKYTKNIYWNSIKLNDNEIAISKIIAKQYNLKTGDKIYSKHIVNNTIQEYIIKEVLPEISNIRIDNQNNYRNGVVIMGYDSLYEENIKHKCLVFTNIPVNDMTVSSVEAPTDIIYRDDEIRFVFLDSLPYIVLFILLVLIVLISYVLLLYQLVIKNAKRYITLGYEKKYINKAISKYLYESIVPVVFVSLLYVGLLILNKLNDIEIAFYIFVIFVEIVVGIITISYLFRKLWRKT